MPSTSELPKARLANGKAIDNSTFVYFHAHDADTPFDCLSQWFPAEFVDPAMGNARFSSSEQYMMAMKARLMRDTATYEKIMASTSPGEAKGLGRSVENFRQGVSHLLAGNLWDAACDKIVERGNWLKFSQNSKSMAVLLSTGQKALVEASPTDRIWGIGYDVSEAEENETSWGDNKLGQALMRVRQRLVEGEREGEWPKVINLEGCTSCGGCGQSHSAAQLGAAIKH
ncbi:hypothetical protein EMMF5_002240 [Cystobasidiomycetes sp. EMM_F5]